MTKQKIEAVRLLRQLGVSEDVIEDFESFDTIPLFYDWGKTSYATFEIFEACCDASGETAARLKDCIVYAALNTLNTFGECVEFLFVPKYPEDWPHLVQPTSNKRIHTVYAYVLNLDYPDNSEPGYITVENIDGKLFRRS